MRRTAFTLEQIRSFAAVAETEHVSRAAAALFLTQAAVTQQLRHFEQAVGLQLLERSGRRVRLTDAGRTLAEACRAALRAVEVMDDTAKAARELEEGSLHVGASPTCASYYLPPHLAEFARRYPAVRLDVAVAPTAELNAKVLAGSLDCALVEGDPDPTLTSVELSPERNVRELIGEPYDRLETMNLGHPEYVRALTIAGLGFAALPKRAVIDDMRRGILKSLAVPPIVRSITAVRRPARGGPAQEAFWDQLTGNLD